MEFKPTEGIPLRQNRGSRVPLPQILIWRGQSIFLWMGWFALVLILVSKFIQNIKAAAPLLSSPVYFIRDDFDHGFNRDIWRDLPVVGLSETALYPKDNIDYRDGKLVMKLKHNPSYFYGKSVEFRGAILGSKYRFIPPFRVTARLRAALGPGAIAGFFTYTDPNDGNPHYENDFEFPMGSFRKEGVWTNIYAPGGHPTHGDAKPVLLDFDAGQNFADYTLDVYPEKTIWKVNGKEIRVSNFSGGAKPQRVFLNFWFARRWGSLIPTADFDHKTTDYLVDWVQIESLPVPLQ